MSQDRVNRPLLIIEDDLDIRDAIRELLEEEGYQIFEASHGAEALVLLGKIPKPGLVLLDLMMPVMDGHQFLQELRANPDFADLPVVVVSAGITVAPTIAGFIRKPFETQQLLRMVDKHFQAPGLKNGRDAESAPG